MADPAREWWSGPLYIDLESPRTYIDLVAPDPVLRNLTAALPGAASVMSGPFDVALAGGFPDDPDMLTCIIASPDLTGYWLPSVSVDVAPNVRTATAHFAGPGPSVEGPAVLVVTYDYVSPDLVVMYPGLLPWTWLP